MTYGRRRSGDGAGEALRGSGMEANLLAAEPSALALHEFNQGCDEQQPEAEARENGGKQADVEGTTRGGFRRRAATISFLALGLMQVLWVALLGYGAYAAVTWLR